MKHLTAQRNSIRRLQFHSTRSNDCLNNNEKLPAFLLAWAAFHLKNFIKAASFVWTGRFYFARFTRKLLAALLVRASCHSLPSEEKMHSPFVWQLDNWHKKHCSWLEEPCIEASRLYFFSSSSLINERKKEITVKFRGETSERYIFDERRGVINVFVSCIRRHSFSLPTLKRWRLASNWNTRVYHFFFKLSSEIFMFILCQCVFVKIRLKRRTLQNVRLNASYTNYHHY